MAKDFKAEIEHINFRLKQYKELGMDFRAARSFVLSCAGEIVPAILDLGTGRGHMANAIAQKGYELTTLDNDQEMLDIASAYAASLGLANKINYQLGDIEKLKFKDQSYSTIICVDLWHHLQNYKKALDEILRVWNKKGPLVIADMNRQGLDIIAKVHAGEGRKHGEGEVGVEKVGDFLKEKEISFKKFEGNCHTVFVAKC